MIGEQPRHGYELMKAIEERMGGSYSPSPGAIYPTLSWLEDMGYAVLEAEEAGRKRYRITAEGQAFLTANHTAGNNLFSRIAASGTGSPVGCPPLWYAEWRTSNWRSDCASGGAPSIKRWRRPSRPPLTEQHRRYSAADDACRHSPGRKVAL